eukprot:168636-Rhodomonas_salina.3
MAVIAVISLWKLREFQPRLEDEIPPNIITDTIHALRARSGADALIVWVHAHAGDPGNGRQTRKPSRVPPVTTANGMSPAPPWPSTPMP